MNAAQPFLLDPANQAYAAGTSREVKTKVPLAGMMFLGLLCFAGLMAALILGREWGVWTQYRRAPTVTALVGNVQFDRSRRNLTSRRRSNSYTHLTYTFRAPNSEGKIQSYTSSYVLDGIHSEYRIGGPITIRYLARDPNRTRPESAMNATYLVVFSVVAVVLNLVVWWRLIDSFAVGRLEKRLAEGSTLLPGEVISCDGVLHTEEHRTTYDLVMHYRFLNPQDKELSGYVTQQRNDLRGQLLPSRGTPLMVAYIDDNHYKVL